MKRALFAFALLLQFAPAGAAFELSLQDAIDLALRQNRELLTQQLNLESRGLSLESAGNEFRWTVTPDGNAGLTQDGSSSRVGLGLQKKTTLGTELDGGLNYNDDQVQSLVNREGSVHVQIRQPLLKNSGRLANTESLVQAQSAVRSARRQLELQRIDLVVRVAELHQNILRLQNQLVSDEKSMARYDQLYRLTRAREAQGRATRVDSLRTEFQRGRAELTLSSTRENLESTRKDLADLLALPPSSEIIALSGPVMSLDTTETTEAENVALSNRLDFADALQALRDAQRGVKIAESNVRPKLDLVTRYEKLGTGETFGDATELDEDIWFVGFAGDTDIHLRDERINLSQARIDAAGAENQIALLENSIRRQVQQALLNYARAARQVTFAERNHALASDRARLARRLFEIGRSDNFTVTDAENELLEADSEMLRSRAENNVAVYRVLRTLGTLIEGPEDLKPRRGTNS